MKKPIATIPYDDVDFKWVVHHYDIHLAGSCIYNGKLCSFQTISDPEWNEEEDEWELPEVNVYPLSWKERLEYRWSQFKFEQSVGYHWSYRDGKRGENFKYRKPQWFYKWLFKMYFKLK